MKIVSWNVNGLRSAMSKNFLQFVEEYSPDVLCLQETRLPIDVANSLELPFKYKVFSEAERKGYSGTAILSNIEPLSMRAVQLENHPEEGRITVAEFEKFTLVNAYIPNSQDGLKRLSYRTQAWDNDFRAFFSSQKPVVVCGDFNVAHEPIDIARPGSNTQSAGYTLQERQSFTKHLEAGFVDIWRKLHPQEVKYSWWSYRFKARERNIGWRIDYFLVSNDIVSEVKSAEILDNVGGSDHCPISVEF